MHSQLAAQTSYFFTMIGSPQPSEFVNERGHPKAEMASFLSVQLVWSEPLN
jgi:hypothetical protein